MTIDGGSTNQVVLLQTFIKLRAGWNTLVTVSESKVLEIEARPKG